MDDQADKPPTNKQLEVLKFIVEYLELHGVPPTQRDICGHLACNKTSARGHLLALERKKVLELTKLGSRNLKLTDRGRKLLQPKTQDLQLFVWEEVLVDYTEGIMFALASSVDEARALILDRYEPNWRKTNQGYPKGMIQKELEKPYSVHTAPVGFILHGGT